MSVDWTQYPYHVHGPGAVYGHRAEECPIPTCVGLNVVVIDYDDAEQVDRLCDALYGGHAGGVAARVRAALREFADPKPRIEEPQNQGAVIEDDEGRRWLRRIHGGTLPWVHYDIEDRATRGRTWSDLSPVRVLSEGVPS